MFKIRKCNRNVSIKLSEVDIINSAVRKSYFLNMRLRKVKVNTDCFVVRNTSIKIKWMDI